MIVLPRQVSSLIYLQPNLNTFRRDSLLNKLQYLSYMSVHKTVTKPGILPTT